MGDDIYCVHSYSAQKYLATKYFNWFYLISGVKVMLNLVADIYLKFILQQSTTCRNRKKKAIRLAHVITTYCINTKE